MLQCLFDSSPQELGVLPLMRYQFLLVEQLPIKSFIAQVEVELCVVDKRRAIRRSNSPVSIELIKLRLEPVIMAKACKVVLVISL